MVRAVADIAILVINLVRILAAAQGGGSHAFADLDPFDGVDRHHGAGQIAVELAIDWRAKADGHALCHNLDHGTDGIVVLAAQVIQRVVPQHGGFGIGAPEIIAADFVPVKAAAVNGACAHLHHITGDFDLRCQRLQHLAGDTASGDARRSLARGRASTTAIIADAVFLVIGDIGVTGTKALGDIAIIFRALVGVADQQLDRGAGGLALEHAGQDLDRIGLLPLGGVAVLAGFALVQPMLQQRLVDRNAGRAAVHDSAQRRPVAFTPGGKAEQVTKCIQAHAYFPPLQMLGSDLGESVTR
ncbi:hypothetical protein KVU_2321 [Ketogulonicigenium vulgare WSH-001]|uniref:Uncharacterized protein n=1 Tax=Ketogulonicigenium vulgare (strain WSH-001) TaxID=759362 RepID=F9Y6P0_KETVW|nr:hypothetical protein KVU_2321 [Ketogulonicigenium vulgare WSH-001]